MSERPEERPAEDLLVCERGHHIRTSTALIICPARGEGAHDGVFGPACGADIVSMVLPIGEFAEAVAAARAEGEQAGIERSFQGLASLKDGGAIGPDCYREVVAALQVALRSVAKEEE